MDLILEENELLGMKVFIVVFRIMRFCLKIVLRQVLVWQNTKFSDQLIIEAICNYPPSKCFKKLVSKMLLEFTNNATPIIQYYIPLV